MSMERGWVKAFSNASILETLQSELTRLKSAYQNYLHGLIVKKFGFINLKWRKFMAAHKNAFPGHDGVRGF